MLSRRHAPAQDKSHPSVSLAELDQLEGTLANRVYRALREAILTLAYAPGEALKKGEICEQMGVSRSPVSEAITRLAADGLVDVIPQSGTFVAKFRLADIREGAFLREALETAVIERVATTISDDQLLDLRRNFRAQEAAVADRDDQDFYRLDSEMHQLIMSFTEFKRLSGIAESSWLHVNRARQLILPNATRVKETLEEHRAILDALRARDPIAAKRATRDHLRKLMTYIEPLATQQPELFS